MDINSIESEFVNKCKLLSMDVQNHSKLIKNENFLEMLVVSLASSEPSISKTAIETLHVLLQGKSNISAIISTNGILEAVNFASERLIDEKTTKLAKDILCTLTGPAYGTRSRRKQQLLEEQGRSHSMMTKQIVLHIGGINTDNQTDLQKVLIQQKGIVSIHINVDEQLCTMRVMKNISPRELAKVINKKLNMQAKLVVRSDIHKEMILTLDDEEDDLPSYVPEQDSPVRNKAVSMMGQWKAGASGVLQWFQKSFYW